MAVPRGPSRRRLAAIRRMRANVGATEALLELARALAELTTSPEAAQRIAEAVPEVTGCDQATAREGATYRACVLAANSCADVRACNPREKAATPKTKP